MFFGGRVYCTYTGVLLALGLRARARLEGMVSMVCCGGAVAGYSPACAAPVALLLVSQVRKDGLMLFIRVGYHGMPLVGLVLEQRRCCAAAALPGSAPGRPRCRSR